MTRHEVLRGLKAKRATAQLEKFEILCALLQVLPLTDAATVRAADIHADLYLQGELIGDADILIAATAIKHGCVLVQCVSSYWLQPSFTNPERERRVFYQRSLVASAAHKPLSNRRPVAHAQGSL